MNLSDRVLGPSLRAQTVGTRFEVRLEDRFGHQLQRGLHDSVSDSRDPQRADLAARLGNRLLPHPLGPEPASFEIISQPVQHRLDTQDDRSRRDPIDSGGSRALVCPHPAPRHNEKRRVIDDVEHVIERTPQDRPSPIGAASTASRVPAARPPTGQATKRRYSPADSPLRIEAATTLGPFAMCTAFPCSDYYEPSAPSRRHQPATGLPARRPGRAAERDQRDGSHVHS